MIFEAASEGSWAIKTGEDFVAQISMTMFDVDPRVSGLLRQHTRCNKVVDDLLELIVAEDPLVVCDPQSLVEHRMSIDNPWFRSPLIVGPCVASGVSQLKTDTEVVCFCKMLCVSINQQSAKWSEQDKAWIRMRLQDSHAEGGFGITPNALTCLSAFYS